MARRKRKKQSSSFFTALVMEGLAIVVFGFLFTQAQAERQADRQADRQAEDRSNRESIPVLEGMFQPAPYYNIVARNE